jgi:multiple sugar transport system permease protein
MTDHSLKARMQTPKLSRWESVRTSNQWQRGVRQALSYVFLLIGAAFMLFPLLWMFSASLKPAWQIFTSPPIWIPQHWQTVNAGSTNREIPLFYVTHEGEQQEVVQIGTRRYTTVFSDDSTLALQNVPSVELNEAVPTTVGDVVLNVRTWITTGQQVVALARGDDDTLVVALVEDLQQVAQRLPLDVVNSGERTSVEISGTEFRGREITTDNGSLSVIPIGPESDLSVVAPPQTVQEAQLVPANSITAAGEAVIGETELALWRLEDSEADYILLSREAWQPVINDDELATKAFVASGRQLEPLEARTVNGVQMQVSRFTPEDDSEPYEVAVLVSGTTRSLVIPISTVQTLRLAAFGGLTSTRGATTDRIAYRVQDGFAEGDTVSSVALVGELQDMALIVSSASVADAFDVDVAALERNLTPQLRFNGYSEALQTKVGDTYFPTFFRNSFLLVALNIVGHVLSCVIVAYAFARMRAPGKNILFLILLSSMMLPFPVTIVPMYEIFRDLGMVNTLFPLFIRSFFGNAFLIFMLRQFFASIPRELEEAARIDGANVIEIIWYIFVPLSKAAIATVVIFTFWWTWNSFLEPLIYLSSPDLFPVTLGLSFFKDQYGTIYYDRMIAASVMSMLPMLFIFFFSQRYFIEGIQLTGMKG